MRWWTSIVIALAACGGGASTGPRKPVDGAARPPDSAAGETAAIRARVKAFCGASYSEKVDGCDQLTIGAKGRGKVVLATQQGAFDSIEIELVVAANDAGAQRARALELVADLFDDAGRATVRGALDRLFNGVADHPDATGSVGPLVVRAATAFDLAAPAQRTITLEVRHGTGSAPLATSVSADELASPAKPTTDAWVATAKAACTELIAGVLKSHKVEDAPAVWDAGDLYVECKSPDENSVAQFTLTWAPGTRKLLFARIVAEMPQKKFAALVDKLLVPLLTPAQLTAARTAAKKEPLDHKFGGDGIQVGSRHDTGGFYGESHEIDLSVQPGYKADGSIDP